MEFVNPKILWGLIPLFCFLIVLLKLKAKRGQKRYLEVSNEEFYRELPKWKKIIVGIPAIAICVAFLMMYVPFAEPLGSYVKNPLSALGKELQIVVDLSTSMKGGAISVIKDVLKRFIKGRRHDYIGIIAFGGNTIGSIDGGRAAIVRFPTHDSAVVEGGIEDLEPGKVGYCTSIGEGTLLAFLVHTKKDSETLPMFSRTRFRRNLIKPEDWPKALSMIQGIGPYKNKVTILFTDGLNNAGIDPTGPLWISAKKGIRVHFVAVKQSAATGVPDSKKAIVKGRLRQAVLATGGQYFEAASLDEVGPLFKVIDEMESDRVITGMKIERQSLSWLFYVVAGFFVLIAIICFLILSNYF